MRKAIIMTKKLLNSFLICVLCVFTSTAQLQLISDFTFDGNLNDSQGNGSMSIMNGANYSYNNGMLTNGVDSTSAAPGLKVTLPDGVFNEEEYTIQLDFSFSETSGYRKVMDVKELTDDGGLYINDQLRLYNTGNYGPTTIAVDSMISVVIVRNTAVDSAWVYLTDGVSMQLESSAADPGNYFVSALSGSDRVLHFFHDDSVTTSEFSSEFTVDRIQIWNGNTINTASVKPMKITSFSCFPNPATTQAILQFTQPESGLAELLTADGRLIRSISFSQQQEVIIPLEMLSEGMYLVRYNNEVIRLLKK